MGARMSRRSRSQRAIQKVPQRQTEAVRKPSATDFTPTDFTPQERRLISTLRTPAQVQRFLSALPYNWEKKKDTLRTFRGVVRHHTAHCLEAAITAAAILEQHGHPPLLLSLESQDDLDHVVFLFKNNGKYGSIGRSRDFGLHGRKPVFRSLRDLVMSYVDTYVDGSGRITGYGVGNLNDLVKGDWRLSARNTWEVERALIAMPHKKLKTSDRRYEKTLRQFRAFKKKFPNRPVDFYPNRRQWMV